MVLIWLSIEHVLKDWLWPDDRRLWHSIHLECLKRLILNSLALQEKHELNTALKKVKT